MLQQRADARLVKRKCNFCGGTFYAKRPDAKYHSAACRNKALRWRKRLEKHYGQVFNLIVEIASYADYPDAQPMTAHYLNGLSAHLKQTMRDKQITVIR